MVDLAAPEADATGRWPVLLLMGPTATGKTDLALAIAERFPVALISVDSAMVYRGLDIGSAKPPPSVLARHPHALVDIRDPAEPYSAADFRHDAMAAMAAARAAGKVPLLVGGTMLYFNVLERGIARMPASDPALRARLEARLAAEGSALLHEELRARDPVAAERIHPNNRQRLLRALEVQVASGRPISWWWQQADAGAPLTRDFRPHHLALLPADRAELHARIERRFDAMLAAGLLEEVRQLRARGDLHGELPALRAVGYRQVWSHLSAECDAAEMRRQALVATRGLLRRQLTWLRKHAALEWPRCELAPAADAALAGVIHASLNSAEARPIVIER
ncbi:MAG: tRNA (adenosine(37)-N6)-dimethylallyltransferase MiaA [Gammaproteobacteria bacterium]|nr:tRNA (adenosine(37)-N6)-dimethylallyltransferase MiaA [Gammaproteobacteria bacterium]